jgi:hypothetical protein
MKKTTGRIIVAALFLFTAFASVAASLAPGQGVTFSQVSYAEVQDGANTATGMIAVDLNQLRQSTGMTSGYLNAATSNGWVVRNLPLLLDSQYPYSMISAEFNLGVQAGTPVSQMNVALEISDAAQASFPATPATPFAVGSESLVIGGVPGADVVAPPAPPNLTDILFGDPTNNDTVTQFDHPNIQAARNQCMPASVANSLQYLKDTQGLAVPHPHLPGLKDNSLVGQLELAMNRTATSRTNGQGVWGLQGKLSYLAANGLAQRVAVSHWGSEAGANSGTGNVSATANNVTATSTGMGANMDFAEVLQAMREGQDCELVYSWPTGAHAVDLVAAGITRGKPWIVHASDLKQTHQGDPNDRLGAGPRGFVFEYLTGPDQNGRYSLSGTNKKVVQVICEKYVPPPAMTVIELTNDPAGHSCCVPPPPPTINIEINGTMTVSGNAPYLPMTGTLSPNGAFSLSSRGTVAGFPDVDSTFTGMAAGNTYTGTITVGTQGELFGVPISWNVVLNGPPQPMMPAIRVNGFRHEYSSTAAELKQISISMRAGDSAGENGDWWLVASALGGFYYLDLGTMTWQSGFGPSYTGPLTDLPFFALPLELGNLPPGMATLYFGFDSIPNGSLDFNALKYDQVQVTVE